MLHSKYFARFVREMYIFCTSDTYPNGGNTAGVRQNECFRSGRSAH